MSKAYIEVINDMCEGVKTSVRTLGGDTNDFHFHVGLHHGLSLSLFFTILIDELTKEIHNKVAWYMLFANDNVVFDEIRYGVNNKLER